MSREHFGNLLQDLADQAAPIDDLAERTIQAYNRPRPRTLPTVGAGLAVAAALVVAIIAAPIVRGWVSAQHQATGTGSAPVVVLPGTELKPLPDKLDSPILMAYHRTCEKLTTPACVEWRVMTTDGQHYAIDDAPHQLGDLAVSPGGRALAYTTKSGAFMIHNLATGKRTTAGALDREDMDGESGSVDWSRDYQWILLGNSPARIINTETMRTQPLPPELEAMYGFGISNNNAPFPMRHNNDLVVVDKSGAQYRRIDIGSVSSDALEHGITSPDGHRYAARNRNSIAVFDLRTGKRVKDHHPGLPYLDIEEWLTNNRILISTQNPRKGERSKELHILDLRTGKLRPLATFNTLLDVRIATKTFDRTDQWPSTAR